MIKGSKGEYKKKYKKAEAFHGFGCSEEFSNQLRNAADLSDRTISEFIRDCVKPNIDKILQKDSPTKSDNFEVRPKANTVGRDVIIDQSVLCFDEKKGVVLVHNWDVYLQRKSVLCIPIFISHIGTWIDELHKIKNYIDEQKAYDM